MFKKLSYIYVVQVGGSGEATATALMYIHPCSLLGCLNVCHCIDSNHFAKTICSYWLSFICCVIYVCLAQPIYGFASGDPLRFRRAAGHKDLFYIEEKDIEFKDVRNFEYLVFATNFFSLD